MLDESGFGNRLDYAIKKAGYSNSQITKELNLSKNAIGNYKNNQIPNATTLYKLSQLLGITMEYLLTGESTINTNTTEQKLLEAYRGASPDIQGAARRLLNVPEPEPESETETSSEYKIG